MPADFLNCILEVLHVIKSLKYRHLHFLARSDV